MWILVPFFVLYINFFIVSRIVSLLEPFHSFNYWGFICLWYDAFIPFGSPFWLVWGHSLCTFFFFNIFYRYRSTKNYWGVLGDWDCSRLSSKMLMTLKGIVKNPMLSCFSQNNCMLGMGSGQPNRLESLRIALRKAGAEAKGAALASDAFFPFGKCSGLPVVDFNLLKEIDSLQCRNHQPRKNCCVSTCLVHPFQIYFNPASRKNPQFSFSLVAMLVFF